MTGPSILTLHDRAVKTIETASASETSAQQERQEPHVAATTQAKE